MDIAEQLRTLLKNEYDLVPRQTPRDRHRPGYENPEAKIGRNVQFGHDVIVEDDVEIGDGAIIGHRVTLRSCRLAPGVRIEDNCIIGYHTTTGGFSHKLEGFDRCPPAVVGENTLIRTGCVIYHGVTIGNDSWINHNVLLREHTQVGHHTCIGTMSDSEGYNRIGNHVLIHSQVHMCARMTIEDYVFIAPFTVFTNGNPMTYARDVPGTGEQGPVIGFGTQMAVNVVVLPRVVVGAETLIGASTVVTKDVPPLGILMGVPGKLVGRVPDHLRMPETRRREYYGGQLDPENAYAG